MEPQIIFFQLSGLLKRRIWQGREEAQMLSQVRRAERGAIPTRPHGPSLLTSAIVQSTLSTEGTWFNPKNWFYMEPWKKIISLLFYLIGKSQLYK